VKSVKLANFFLNHSTFNKNVHNYDNNGLTPGHYVVSPLPFGSYQNVIMLKTVINSGYDFNTKDKVGIVNNFICFRENSS
jgi:hypothetical protein